MDVSLDTGLERTDVILLPRNLPVTVQYFDNADGCGVPVAEIDKIMPDICAPILGECHTVAPDRRLRNPKIGPTCSYRMIACEEES